MKILENYNLSKLNTLAIDANARFFVEIERESDLQELLLTREFKDHKKFFLGGGSNTLFTKDFDGIVVANRLKGMEIVEEDEEYAIIRTMGGELWNDLVIFSVSNGYWGIENLALIPGTVGAAPVQNIGAYGVELKDIFLSLEAFEIATGIKKVFNKDECKFGYRDSFFKNKKGEYFISSVTLKFSKKEKKNINYKAIQEYLEKNEIEIHSSKDVSDIVSSIRKDKLPDPKILANAGSFFKNVFVDKIKIEMLLEKYPDMPYFQENGNTKIPAGWLIEQCGWKGKRINKVGVYEKQALVLVNYGGATGEELMDLAHKIILSVKEKFNLELVAEVNLI